MADAADTVRRVEEAIHRALRIARRVAQAGDVELREEIANQKAKFGRKRRRSLCIVEDAWARIETINVNPCLVFAHPKILTKIPKASLHYRGIALLSRKRVQQIAGSVDTWERATSQSGPRMSEDKVLKVCRLYNAVISSIILDNTDWTLEEAYRNVIATIGITEDGAMRNIIGQEAESAVKDRMLRWAQAQHLVVRNLNPQEWLLVNDVHMKFGSEPDIAFERNGSLTVLIEVKGGKDAAGALERLGAIKKTFDEAPIGCRNFLIVGVVTETMRTRLQEMRMEKDFDIDKLLEKDYMWDDLMNEVFHHCLRIAPEVGVQ